MFGSVGMTARHKVMRREVPMAWQAWGCCVLRRALRFLPARRPWVLPGLPRARRKRDSQYAVQC